MLRRAITRQQSTTPPTPRSVFNQSLVIFGEYYLCVPGPEIASFTATGCVLLGRTRQIWGEMAIGIPTPPPRSCRLSRGP